MESKTFLAILIGAQTLILVLAIYLISSYISTQSNVQFQASQMAANERSANSSLIHDYLFNNITDLKKGLDPIIAIIPNATQSEIERQIHYNQTTIDFEKIAKVLEIKLQDHITLKQVNVTVNEILSILKGNNDTNIPVPAPLPTPIIDNSTDDVVDNSSKPTPGPLVDLENKSIIILPKPGLGQ